jgi:ABC-type branched-subunit amino acid transport system ATPase component
MAAVLSVSGLTKSYHGRAAADAASFAVAPDEIVVLLGPNGTGKTTTINMVLGILTPFIGVCYPTDTLPGWIQQVGTILPPTCVFEGLRRLLQRESVNMTDLSVGFCLTLAYIVIAGLYFTRVHRHATRSGLIARYSAGNAN